MKGGSDGFLFTIGRLVQPRRQHLATNRTTDELSSLHGAPTQADQADALVSGFHVTWAASATLLVVGGLLLLALLRRRDVVAVSHGEAAPAAV